MHAHGLTLSENLKEAVEEKIGRIELYAPRAVRARVTLRRISAHPSPRQFQVRVLCELPGRDLSVEESAEDALTGLEFAAKKLLRRLRRRKTKRLARRHREPERS